jgi:microsomal dipeptidase-like Zn-dependent dipeptidase
MMLKLRRFVALAALVLVAPRLAGSVPSESADPSKVYHVANRCYALGATDPGPPLPKRLSVSDSGDGYVFTDESPRPATPFFLKPSGLGRYLFFDDGGAYLVSDGSDLLRRSDLLSDVLTVDDDFESEAEWELQPTGSGRNRFRLKHLLSGGYLTTGGVVQDPAAAAEVRLFQRDGCAEFPEASLDATGRVRAKRFPDGSLFGFVDTHSHILSNFGFGGGGLFHGAPFHPLGVEHALSDCELYHGEDGRKDLFGFGFDNLDGDPADLLLALAFGQTPGPNHATAGWPDFPDWPSTHDSSTHQTQYYKWLERAYLGGLRLVVQHATSNQIICDLIAGLGVQPVRYSCNDMVAVDRILEETRNMEAYIDAQEGGPGRGWFRIVTSPAEARRVIRQGKMAVILGIETSNLFDCFLVPSEAFPACTEQTVIEKLDHYHDLGVRALFPVHKYDNGFSPGDGQKLIIELGNFIQTGHYANFTSDCDQTVPASFDKGPTSFPGLNMPRSDYLAPPPHDFSGFADDPLGTILPFLQVLFEPPGTEEVCQAAGMTQLGEFLIRQMMQRGMIIELDHLPRRSYKRAFELLEENDYPAAGTHGLNNFGKLYRLGGVSKSGFGRCRSATTPATMDDGYQARIALIEENGGFPAEGFGLDLNGFAGGPGPRFGEESVCNVPQEDPVTYPFRSYAGDVTFVQPRLGNRAVDFNTEGLAHIGLLPELIEDVRRDGVTDRELEPLFKSAEGYLRMWEKAEQRASALPPWSP